ncbi:MAG: dTDP-4-dehydrorhamnose reductase, partial [Candidatus Dormibacteraeota bacterium]|nr:dTDP-4-dehydrorhamnose reductase [Candidatus Dormibacteraeota bacterium]
ERVVNCAGWTKVDAAEELVAEATRVNVDGARNVAVMCAEAGVGLCHLSSDYVFDGTATAPIPEDATPNPQSAYGRTKLEGEIAVRAAHPGAHIVRTSWLYGMAGPNFVLTMLRKLEAGDEVRVVDDQHGTPTWTGHLAPALLYLLEIAPPGTYHLSNSGATTWFGFAAAIASMIGAASPLPIATSEYPLRAVRPAYSVLDNSMWRGLGEAPLPDWRDGLRAYLQELRVPS